jgi:predicted GIY-YIG superfamily endonuclease
MAVYLLHFERPYKGVMHYLGYSSNLPKRLKDHRAGRGARLIEVINDAGIDYEVVRVWPEGDRTFERHIKNQKHHWKHCPICRKMKGLK